MSLMASLSILITRNGIMPIHEVDRKLYMILALQLCFGPSLGILAFWIYLEHLGFRNPGKAILLLPSAQIRLIADEAITCLNYLSALPFLSSPQVSDLPLTKRVICAVISLQFIDEYRSNVITGIQEVTHKLCNPALQVVKPGQQSLYARVVLRSPDIIEDILSGIRKGKLAINRKHAWMRKFVLKKKCARTVGKGFAVAPKPPLWPSQPMILSISVFPFAADEIYDVKAL